MTIQSGNRARWTAGIVSLVLVLPLLTLELVNGGEPGNDFPFVLFGVLWLLAIAFCISVQPLVRSPRPSLTAILPRLIVALLAGAVWFRIVLDQMPCFLGVPNCD